MKTTTIIMAGGNGTRFWPKSRTTMPKQFLDLDNNGTLLNQTIARMKPLSTLTDLYIVGNLAHKPLFEKTLPNGFEMDHVLLEPMARNTAAAIAAPVMALHQASGNQVIIVLPSDQHIEDEITFQKQLMKAVKAATEKHQVVTLGITPTFPATGYGYLKANLQNDDIFKLDAFVEKPDIKTAEEYVKSEDYFWNAGIFVFESAIMLEHIQNEMPSLFEQCAKIKNWNDDLASGDLESLYKRMPATSIDYGIMEKLDEIYMVPLDCGWSDLGSWDALSTVMNEDMDNNIHSGDVIALDTNSTTIIGDKKLIAAVGLQDIVIVDTKDALLVCRKQDVQKIKQLVGVLKEKGRLKLL